VAQLADGQIDPRRTALLEAVPPGLDNPPDPALDEASVIADEPDRLVIRTSTAARGLLMLSEVYYPALERVRRRAACCALCGRRSLAGRARAGWQPFHRMSFESAALYAGILISAAVASCSAAICFFWCRSRLLAALNFNRFSG